MTTNANITLTSSTEELQQRLNAAQMRCTSRCLSVTEIEMAARYAEGQIQQHQLDRYPEVRAAGGVSLRLFPHTSAGSFYRGRTRGTQAMLNRLAPGKWEVVSVTREPVTGKHLAEHRGRWITVPRVAFEALHPNAYRDGWRDAENPWRQSVKPEARG